MNIGYSNYSIEEIQEACRFIRPFTQWERVYDGSLGKDFKYITLDNGDIIQDDLGLYGFISEVEDGTVVCVPSICAFISLNLLKAKEFTLDLSYLDYVLVDKNEIEFDISGATHDITMNLILPCNGDYYKIYFNDDGRDDIDFKVNILNNIERAEVTGFTGSYYNTVTQEEFFRADIPSGTYYITGTPKELDLYNYLSSRESYPEGVIVKFDNTERFTNIVRAVKCSADYNISIRVDEKVFSEIVSEVMADGNAEFIEYPFFKATLVFQCFVKHDETIPRNNFKGFYNAYNNKIGVIYSCTYLSYHKLWEYNLKLWEV